MILILTLHLSNRTEYRNYNTYGFYALYANVDGFNVVLNKPKTQAYRAPGSTHVAYACECVIDELARGDEGAP